MEAYVCYRPDIGYVQGMSFLASMFLLVMDTFDAFKCLANLLNRPLFLGFFRMDINHVSFYQNIIQTYWNYFHFSYFLNRLINL